MAMNLPRESEEREVDLIGKNPMSNPDFRSSRENALMCANGHLPGAGGGGGPASIVLMIAAGTLMFEAMNSSVLKPSRRKKRRKKR